MALTDQLIAYYKLDEVSGNAVDATGNGNTLTNNNAVAFAAGLINNGADFGSANTNKSLKTAGYLSASGAITISGWIKLKTEIGAGNYGLFELEQSTSAVSHIVYYNYNGGTRQVAIDYHQDNVLDTTAVANATLGTSAWHHFVYRWDGTNMSLYLDNVQVIANTAASGTGGALEGNNFAIGTSGRFNFFGSIIADEVVVYSRAITPTEIGQLWNGGAGIQFPFGATMSTDPVSALSNTSATLAGTVVSLNGLTLSERGVVYGTVPLPDITNTKLVAAGTGVGSYTVGATGLLPGTQYYCRAYSTSTGGATSYGTAVSFFTTVAAIRQVWKDINGSQGQRYAVRLTVGGSVGTLTVQLGTTGDSVVIPAGSGVYTFAGLYGGTTGVIFTASSDFVGYFDDFMYTKLSPLAVITDVDWTSNLYSTALAIASSVIFRRLEDENFNRFRIYRYLDFAFKNLTGDVLLLIRKEKSDVVSDSPKEFSIVAGSGNVSPFVKKKISFLAKAQALLIGVSNAKKDQTFTISEFTVNGSEEAEREFSGSKVISVQ